MKIKKFEKFVNEGKLTVAGDMVIGLGGKSVVSFEPNSDWVVIFSNSEGTAVVSATTSEFYVDVNNRYDKSFKDIKQLVKWLNKEKYEYAGVERQY